LLVIERKRALVFVFVYLPAAANLNRWAAYPYIINNSAIL
jgi:hypothetical protein